MHLRLALGAVLVPAPLPAEVLEETSLAEGVEALSYRIRISEVTIAEAAAEVFVYAGRYKCSGAVAAKYDESMLVAVSTPDIDDPIP